MISSWVRHYDATHVGAASSALPHDLTLAADGLTPEAPADWIQLPDGSGSTVTVINGAGESLTLTASSTINTWACRATSITACSGNVLCGTGSPPMTNVASVTGATGTAGTNGANGSTYPSVSAVLTADPAPAVIDTFYNLDPSGAAFNVSLPTISSANHGHKIRLNVVTTSAHAVTPVPNGTDTLPSNVTTVAGTYGTLTLMADNNPSPKAWRVA